MKMTTQLLPVPRLTLQLKSCYLTMYYIYLQKQSHILTLPPHKMLGLALYCTGVIRSSKSEIMLLLYLELKSINATDGTHQAS